MAANGLDIMIYPWVIENKYNPNSQTTEKFGLFYQKWLGKLNDSENKWSEVCGVFVRRIGWVSNEHPRSKMTTFI